MQEERETLHALGRCSVGEKRHGRTKRPAVLASAARPKTARPAFRGDGGGGRAPRWPRHDDRGDLKALTVPAAYSFMVKSGHGGATAKPRLAHAMKKVKVSGAAAGRTAAMRAPRSSVPPVRTVEASSSESAASKGPLCHQMI